MLPEVVARTGGSNRMQAQPAGSKWPSALPTCPAVDRGGGNVYTEG